MKKINAYNLLAVLLFFYLFLPHARAQKGYDVSCINPNDCPSAVGVLMLKELTSQVGRCSGFLIAGNQFVTNAHCIPHDLQKKGALCAGRVIVSFPSQKDIKLNDFNCKSILRISALTNVFPMLDYAVLELEKDTGRKPFEMDPNHGVVDGETLKIYKANSGNNGQVVIEPVICKAIQESLVNIYYFEDHDYLLTVQGCPIYQGNSGSAVISLDAKVKGVLSAVVKNDAPKNTAKGIEDSFFYGVGTQIHCTLPDFDCELNKEKSLKKIEAKISQKVELQVQEILKSDELKKREQKLFDDSEELIRWKVEKQHSKYAPLKPNEMQSVVFMPECFNYKKSRALKDKVLMHFKPKKWTIAVPAWYFANINSPKGQVVIQKSQEDMNLSIGLKVDMMNEAKATLYIEDDAFTLPHCN